MKSKDKEFLDSVIERARKKRKNYRRDNLKLILEVENAKDARIKTPERTR